MSYAPTPYGLNGRPRPAFGRAGVKPVPQGSPRAPQFAAPEPEAPRSEPVFYADGRFGISRVLGRMISVLGSDFVTFFALVALFAAPERIAYRTMSGPLGASVGTLLLSVCGYALQLAVMHLALRRFAGVSAGLGGSAGKALMAFFPALLISFLSSLAIAGSMLLLVVPGFMVLLAWSLVLPVYLSGEGGVFSSFGRSSALTRGHRWKILTVMLVVGFGLGVLAALMMPIWGVHGALGAAVFFSKNWLMRLIFNAVFGLALAAMYQELTGAKEADAF